jgi:hypothetical protein
MSACRDPSCYLYNIQAYTYSADRVFMPAHLFQTDNYWSYFNEIYHEYHAI